MHLVNTVKHINEDINIAVATLWLSMKHRIEYTELLRLNSKVNSLAKVI